MCGERGQCTSLVQRDWHILRQRLPSTSTQGRLHAINTCWIMLKEVESRLRLVVTRRVETKRWLPK